MPSNEVCFIVNNSFSAAQAAATANATTSQNIGHIGTDGEEIETKHQPGNMIPQLQHGTHGSHGTLGQQLHPLQAHQQQVTKMFLLYLYLVLHAY